MIQCVGSRDDERPYCSRICCSEAIKNALRIKEVSPETAAYILYRDIRTYGFKEKYYTQARRKGVMFARYEVDRKPEVVRALRVTVFDQTLKLPVEIRADAVVLSAGIRAPQDAKGIAQLLKVPLNKDGFFLEAHMKLRPVDFATEGVFLAGLAHSPKTIEESIIQAQAAACHPGDCHYREGNLRTEKRADAIRLMLDDFGIEGDRFRLEWVSAAEGARFAQVVTEFTEQVKKLGPNANKV
jgi:heterodisulfide reductase subunit A